MAAVQDPLLHDFLDRYNGSYYDWGDDPSFFAAQHLLGDVRKASWGVCRRDLRNSLSERDVVVFFCGAQNGNVWRYYFIGCGTVRALVDRETLWTDPTYNEYRKFYNVLVRLEDGEMVQNETIHKFHDDWRQRADAPYVLFDSEFSSFNLDSPHCVAEWDRTNDPPEKWAADDRSKELEQLLFVERKIDRRLRTSATGYGHVKLNLLRRGGTIRPGRSITELTQALTRLVF